jgi:hypothetical protein
MLSPDVDQRWERKLEPILDDPRDLRTEFLKLPHTESAALAFLNKIGVWDIEQRQAVIPGAQLVGNFGYHYLSGTAMSLTIEDLWYEQEYWLELLRNPSALRKQFAAPPSEAADYQEKTRFAVQATFANTLKIHLEWKRLPKAVIQPVTWRELLVATAWLDVVQQAKIQVCQRRDCGVPFTGPKQKYCDDSCAHLVAVRAHRARKRDEKKQRVRPRKSLR